MRKPVSFSSPARSAGSISTAPIRARRFNRVYWADGDYVPEALAEVNHLLRDYRANQIKDIDPNLLDLLYNLNQKLECDSPFHVISGYRSPRTNAALRKRNRKVARNSLHMAGMAVDLRMPDLHIKYLNNAAQGDALRRCRVLFKARVRPPRCGRCPHVAGRKEKKEKARRRRRPERPHSREAMTGIENPPVLPRYERGKMRIFI